MLTDLRERLLRWRDRRLADPRTQALTVSLPVLRPIANQRARALFDLCIGFVHTQVITACVELDILEILADGPVDAGTVAEKTRLSRDAAMRLLNAAAALKLISRTPDSRFRLDELGAALRGATGVTEMIRHNQTFYRDLADPVALLRGDKRHTELAGYWPYAEGDAGVAELAPEQIGAYSALMGATQPLIADDVMAAYDFSKNDCLLDVGGGDGSFAAAVAQRHPRLRVGAFDLPAVARLAEKRFVETHIAERANAYGGDFHRDPIPGEFDIISLVRILLDHDDTTALHLLRAVHRALPAGGTVLVAEIMSGKAGAETIADAYFGLYLYAMGRGRPRSADEIGALLSEAGFERIRPVDTRRTLMTQLMIATKK